MTKHKRMWQGDIVVKGTMQNARQFAKFLGKSINEMKDYTQTYPYVQESHCGSLATPAANEVRRFLSVGVVPEISGNLTDDAAASLGETTADEHEEAV